MIENLFSNNKNKLKKLPIKTGVIDQNCPFFPKSPTGSDSDCRQTEKNVFFCSRGEKYFGNLLYFFKKYDILPC